MMRSYEADSMYISTCSSSIGPVLGGHELLWGLGVPFANNVFYVHVLHATHAAMVMQGWQKMLSNTSIAM